MFAYQLYLDTKCPACGGDVRVCRNEDNAGAFEALETTCHRQAAIDERTKQAGFKSEPGQMFYAVPIDEDLIVGSGLRFKFGEDAPAESDGGEYEPHGDEPDSSEVTA